MRPTKKAPPTRRPMRDHNTSAVPGMMSGHQPRPGTPPRSRGPTVPHRARPPTAADAPRVSARPGVREPYPARSAHTRIRDDAASDGIHRGVRRRPDRPSPTSESWSSRSIVCFAMRTKSPAASSASSSTRSSEPPCAHGYIASAQRRRTAVRCRAAGGRALGRRDGSTGRSSSRTRRGTSRAAGAGHCAGPRRARLVHQRGTPWRRGPAASSPSRCPRRRDSATSRSRSP